MLREFTPIEELIPSIEAVLKVFDQLGNRKNRNKARMKFVIEKLGFAEFKRRWEEAYVSMGHARPTSGPIKLLAHEDEPTALIMPTSNGAKPSGGNGTVNGVGPESPFAMWKRTNIVPQKQAGYVTAVVKLFMGDMTAGQMVHLADLAERYSNGNLRTTINQNIVIRWVPESRVGELYEELVSQGLSDPGAELVEDIPVR